MEKINLPIYDTKNCALFALGRNAMYAACKILNLKPQDEVLTPAFDCDGSLQPFKVMECKIVFFRSDPHTFNADMDDIKDKITPKTKLIHIINHFGFPQPWEKLLSLRHETGIPILEDNAYSLFSAIGNRLFGTFGDISVFSLRKNLPLTDGGLLRINNPKYSFKLASKKAPWLHPSETLRLPSILKNNLGFRSFSQRVKQVFKLSAGTEPPPLFSEKERGYPEWKLRDAIDRKFACDYLRPMSKLAVYQLSKFSQQDYSDIIDKARYFYDYLSNQISGLPGIRVLWPKLPKKTAPFCLSCLVETRRDVFLAVLRKEYNVMAWPTLSMSVIGQLNRFPEVEFLGRRLLQINLAADKIRLPNFVKHLDKLIRRISELSYRKTPA